jgi:hypothetical protein
LNTDRQGCLVESEPTFDLGYPEGWLPIEPPRPAVALVVSPYETNGFFPNLVVTLTQRPTDVNRANIDQYLWHAVSALSESLTEPSIEGVWVTEPDCPQAQQRVVVHHLVDGVAVEMAQHHTWLNDGIVVITASIAMPPDPELIATLDVCLLSAADDVTATFVDWQPSEAEFASSWSPASDAQRIAHL